jgi:hypothetical protein
MRRLIYLKEYEKQQQKIANLQKARSARAEQRYISTQGTHADRNKYQFYYFVFMFCFREEFNNSLKICQQQKKDVQQREKQRDDALVCLYFYCLFLPKNSSVLAADIQKNQEYDARDKAYRERSKEFRIQNKIVGVLFFDV